MTWETMLARAKKICNQPATANSGLWLDYLWLEVANEIQKEIVNETNAMTRKVTDAAFKTFIDQDYISSPYGIIRPTLLFVDFKKVRYKDPGQIEVVNPGWLDYETRYPHYWYFKDDRIYFDCKCDKTYDTTIWGIKLPDNMTAGSSVPFENKNYLSAYHRVLLFGLIMEFFSDTGDEQGAKYEMKYEQGKEKMKLLVHQGAEEGDLQFSPAPQVFTSEV